MSVGYNDILDRDWGRHFLISTNNKTTLINGSKFGRDIEASDSNYGVDVEHAQKYNPLTRDRPISIPYRKSKIGKYWDNKETDYIQFIGNGNRKLIYIKDEIIKSYKGNPIERGNYPYDREYTWKGMTREECQKLFNTYIEIPKDKVQVWIREGIGKQSKWVKHLEL
jgi:hypothetical protein|tara:strand:- start:30 stop:530 length:501 start_codon:yes stop_codon:yes gene_type:complete